MGAIEVLSSETQRVQCYWNCLTFDTSPFRLQCMLLLFIAAAVASGLCVLAYIISTISWQRRLQRALVPIDYHDRASAHNGTAPPVTFESRSRASSTEHKSHALAQPVAPSAPVRRRAYGEDHDE